MKLLSSLSQELPADCQKCFFKHQIKWLLLKMPCVLFPSDGVPNSALITHNTLLCAHRLEATLYPNADIKSYASQSCATEQNLCVCSCSPRHGTQTITDSPDTQPSKTSLCRVTFIAIRVQTLTICYYLKVGCY